MEKPFAYRIFRQGGETLLAIADADIIGKTFAGEGMQLEVAPEFYAGQVCTTEDVAGLVRSATIVNAAGERVVELLVREGMVSKDMVLRVGNVPHAQIIMLGK
ncbi:MAG: DUF424 family protein [Candidatus Aenigmarchaeota archaeon]|nr:DUF424 family protein [Candidatus Aenigmarchaeota archaeon]